MAKPKIVYQEKYRVGGMMVKNHSLPRLRHLAPNCYVKSCEIQSHGRLDDGTEFQILKVVLKESEIKG